MIYLRINKGMLQFRHLLHQAILNPQVTLTRSDPLSDILNVFGKGKEASIFHLARQDRQMVSNMGGRPESVIQ